MKNYKFLSKGECHTLPERRRKMKKPISNTEWANKQNQKLLFAIISILVSINEQI